MTCVCLKNNIVVAIFATKEDFENSQMIFMEHYDTFTESANPVNVGDVWSLEKGLSDEDLTIYLCGVVDVTADTARLAVAGDPLRVVEYQWAAEEAQKFKDAGYPLGDVPRAVSAWAVGDRGPQEAADDILAEATAYSSALYAIRETRLLAKEQIRASVAAGDREPAVQFTQNVRDSILNIVVGVGNNR
jgi:hypothetical protein